ncbi:uncharacterized protein VDAG_08925 [Verticillium dahliae VdLs.17]|uniref:Uncharacterized protein n=1 Tax=Verticillium dahliae (strain VdLs.17 / ATCC MYA-4575 / FGSC 10137) TaxID=498257 RepID=G2XGD8_VERDV|nr:uncharacterized protein VDAG_08925 [Verticillium dahliae VdLs.17]EGY18765.1 hypothetical protein VDAG_08925 [Verticillium dahliae VdLs.17]
MRPTLALRAFRPTLRMRSPVPVSSSSARTKPVCRNFCDAIDTDGSFWLVDRNKRRHTVSQRLRKLRRIPPELIPLGVVVGFAVFAAGYSSIRHFMVDGTIRLKRQGPKHSDSHGEESH